MFPEIVIPQNGWFIMENPIKMDDLGVPLFSETSIWHRRIVFLKGNLEFSTGGFVGFSASPGDDEASHRLCPGKGKNLRGANRFSLQHTYGGWRFSHGVNFNKHWHDITRKPPKKER